jgi:hypothetical protein
LSVFAKIPKLSGLLSCKEVKQNKYFYCSFFHDNTAHSEISNTARGNSEKLEEVGTKKEARKNRFYKFISEKFFKTNNF